MKTGTRLVTTFEQFEVLDRIGSGGSGDVVLAQASDGTQVAIKALRPNQPKVKLNRFRNELSFCSANVHKNIIRVLDRGVYPDKSGDQPFYVMPHYESTLRKEMAKNRSAQQNFELFVQILDGVEAAHLQKIIHRDLKPENILINPASTELVIADFGIAHFEEAHLVAVVETRPGDRVGSWEYAAPEQRRAGQAIDHRADIYSLGLILVELFTGTVPHGASPKAISSFAPEFAYLDSIAESMRQNAVEQRPPSIDWIKREMIAQRADLVQRQKLDEVRNTAIPAAQVSDPLVSNPITLTHVEYRNGSLYFTLSGRPNRGWIMQFTRMGNHSAVVGSEPEKFTFDDKEAVVPVNEQSAQWVVNHFKNYLQITNAQYSLATRTAAAQAEESQRRRLQEEADRLRRAIETNERVNSQLKW